MGALRTDDAVRLAQDAKAAGASAGLLSAASYTPLSDDEVFEHFSTVAREGSLPVVIYDNPSTTHFRCAPELISRLAKVPGIIGIKNPGWSSEDAPRLLKEQRSIVRNDFSIGCSGDWMAAETMIAGANTWYSVLGGVLPEVCVKLVRAAQHGHIDEVRSLDRKLEPIWELFRQHSSLRVVYTLVDLLGICRTEPPRPILPLQGPALQQVAKALQSLPPDICPR